MMIGRKGSTTESRTTELLNMNMELTTQCPLQCPFCYCLSTEHRSIPLKTALYWIEEAHRNHVRSIAFSGGEVLCYPYLDDVISAAKSKDCTVIMATSGYGLDQDRLKRLMKAGIDGIHVSLNGTTEEINRMSRNGYQYARDAIKLMCSEGFPFAINFVLTRDNADDLHKMIGFAECFRARTLSILALKPDSSKSMVRSPTVQQLRAVAQTIAQYSGPVFVGIESCYSELICLVQSINQRPEYACRSARICRAGIHCVSVGIDGRLLPCRHLSFSESWETLRGYLDNSVMVRQLQRLSEQNPIGCERCRFAAACRPCVAIRYDTMGSLDAVYPCPIQTE